MKLMLVLGMSALLLSTDVESSLTHKVEVQPESPFISSFDTASAVQLSRVYIDFGIHAPIGRHGRIDLYFGGPGYYYGYPRHYRHRHHFHRRHYAPRHYYPHYPSHHYRKHYRHPHRFKHHPHGRPHARPDFGPPRHHWKRHHKDRYYRNHHVAPRHPNWR